MIKMQEGVPLISSRIFIAGSQKHCFKRTTKKKLAPGYPRALSLFACKTASGTRAHIRL